MDDIYPVTDVERPRGRPFEPDVSGNPSGRPKGARNKTTMAVEALLDGEAEALTRKVVETALKGDAAALRFCVARLLPPRRDRPVEFDLPEIACAGDAVKVARAVLATRAGHLVAARGRGRHGLAEPNPHARGRRLRGQADRAGKAAAGMNRLRLYARAGSTMRSVAPRSAPWTEAVPRARVSCYFWMRNQRKDTRVSASSLFFRCIYSEGYRPADRPVVIGGCGCLNALWHGRGKFTPVPREAHGPDHARAA
jgi:hypothetical protein